MYRADFILPDMKESSCVILFLNAYSYLEQGHNLTKEADRVKGESGKVVCETITQLNPIPEFSDTIKHGSTDS